MTEHRTGRHFRLLPSLLAAGLLVLCVPAHAEPVTSTIAAIASSVGSWATAAAASGWVTAAMTIPSILSTVIRSKR